MAELNSIEAAAERLTSHEQHCTKLHLDNSTAISYAASSLTNTEVTLTLQY